MGNPGGQSAADTRSAHTLAAMPMICMVPGLPPLPKKMVKRIRTAQYIEFTELPPAKGKSRSLAQPTEGQIIVLLTADLVQTRKTIADYATWSQCYAHYVAVLAAHQPGRLADLMGYQSIIACMSKKYKWPSWVIHDQNFRQEAKGNPDQPWAKAEGRAQPVYAVLHWARTELVNQVCQGLDHSSADCPYQTRKLRWREVRGALLATAKMSNSHA